MNVSLVSITEACIKDQKMTAEELIVYIARVSNPANQMNIETSDKLIAYLIKNYHWSPFEMVDMCVEITTSRVIAQQILRHRSFSFQEFSQRYAEVTDMEPIELRKQADKNRQSSTEVFDPNLWGNNLSASRLIEAHIKEGQELYKELLKMGTAKESARFVLPLTTQTKIYMKGSMRSWIHYLQIRCDGHTQLEHQSIALEILKIFKVNFPNLSKALTF